MYRVVVFWSQEGSDDVNVGYLDEKGILVWESFPSVPHEFLTIEGVLAAIRSFNPTSGTVNEISIQDLSSLNTRVALRLLK